MLLNMLNLLQILLFRTLNCESDLCYSKDLLLKRSPSFRWGSLKRTGVTEVLSRLSNSLTALTMAAYLDRCRESMSCLFLQYLRLILGLFSRIKPYLPFLILGNSWRWFFQWNLLDKLFWAKIFITINYFLFLTSNWGF